MNNPKPQFDDESDMSYRKYVLYVKNGDPRCARVVEYVNASSLDGVVALVDAMTVKPRPAWLTAVPTLLSTADNHVAQGELGVLEALKKTRAQTVSHSDLGGASCMTSSAFCDDLFNMAE